MPLLEAVCLPMQPAVWPNVLVDSLVTQSVRYAASLDLLNVVQLCWSDTPFYLTLPLEKAETGKMNKGGQGLEEVWLN